MAGSRFVFLDRDGVLVHDVGHGHLPEHYTLLAGVIEGLTALRDAGYRLVIVTNQSGIGRGIFTREHFEGFQRLLLDELAAAGIEIEATFMCPHHPDDACDCRKPNPASLFAVRDRMGADLANSWMIGDHVSDVKLAANAGCHGILVLTGHGEEERRRLGDTPVDAVVADLSQAVQHILAHERDRTS